MIYYRLETDIHGTWDKSPRSQSAHSTTVNNKNKPTTAVDQLFITVDFSLLGDAITVILNFIDFNLIFMKSRHI